MTDSVTRRLNPEDEGDLVLTLSCPDRPGIVAAVTQHLFERRANIEESQQFSDHRTGRYFMRVRFDTGLADVDVEDWRREFDSVAGEFGMVWELRKAVTAYRMVVMVSRFGHVLNDLLFRWKSGQINADIVGIVSNHTDLEPMARSYGIPFHHIPVTRETKAGAEAQLRELVAAHDVELIALARYMQVLSDDLCRDLGGRVINIHHSFLPSFKGAKPYHQAFARGVKVIGATAHYVTADLDEGPIIEQDIHRVDHRMNAEDLVAAGEEVESRVFARAVKWHCESRIILNEDRTIVFS
ncbi:formyltetrahydrofolate deformylase [Knoellia subterranea]|uniref:Formyltetrahydrofolate deformylase n=1 Tax=Knoellia subterranea KCTC 19937 TaxID=1385521 RepID=A0A0A0JPM5_9MICO|nr:formyltetrahydrofolate deformylase [Knoellia subterranea]KGN39405.1 formyltetrahydrofolate deformylase [Knoellia subterranea KCTC 19937]